jgi:hypothetical protein
MCEMLEGKSLGIGVDLRSGRIKDCGLDSSTRHPIILLFTFQTGGDWHEFLRLIAPLPVVLLDADLARCLLSGLNCQPTDRTKPIRFGLPTASWSHLQHMFTEVRDLFLPFAF